MEACWLVRNGVPFETAFAVDDELRLALSIAFGELDGAEFDWALWRFRPTGNDAR